MTTCCCSSPYCIANGCMLLKPYQPIQWSGVMFPPTAAPPPIPTTYAPRPLTAEDVRRIVREELAHAKGEALNTPDGAETTGTNRKE